ncbi:Gfo/Idh/MocA family protein [Humibacter albus]|uniref:Gfo/Idh/MocA family protein n=1 Tax=Humibacter albus TaxID=427754 RepID=UPI0003B63AB6|nr:Gfo/Idh/MocA family oxidoreductase [Humibacter albus]
MTVAIVGPGSIGAAHAAAWRQVGADVAYLVARQSDAALADAPAARTVTRLDEALADPTLDIVTICTPTPTHRELAVASLRAGKHVLLEKPMALSVADAESIAREADTCGRVLMVAHVVRFFDAYARVREAVAAGEVGRVLHVRAERMIAPPTTPWWHDEDLSGGVAVDVGIHDLDQANLLLGTPVAVRSYAADALGPVETTVRYAGGGTAQVLSHARMPASRPFATSLQVTGDAGMLRIRDDEEASAVPQLAGAGSAEGAGAARNPYATQAAHFLECVASGTPSAIAPTSDAVLALRTALAARDSVRAGGAWVELA